MQDELLQAVQRRRWPCTNCTVATHYLACGDTAGGLPKRHSQPQRDGNQRRGDQQGAEAESQMPLAYPRQNCDCPTQYRPKPKWCFEREERLKRGTAKPRKMLRDRASHGVLLNRWWAILRIVPYDHQDGSLHECPHTPRPAAEFEPSTLAFGRSGAGGIVPLAPHWPSSSRTITHQWPRGVSAAARITHSLALRQRAAAVLSGRECPGVNYTRGKRNGVFQHFSAPFQENRHSALQPRKQAVF